MSLYRGTYDALPLYAAPPAPSNGGTVQAAGTSPDGLPCLTITTQTASTETVLEWTSFAGGPAMGDVRGFSVWLHLTGALASAGLTLRISPSASTYNGGLFMSVPSTGFVQGWNRIWFRPQQMSAWAQNQPWANMRAPIVRARIGIAGASTGAPATVVLGPIHYALEPRGILCMTADDNLASFYTHLWPSLRAYRLPLTMFAVGGPWDGANSVALVDGAQFTTRMSEGQLDEMYASGLVDVGNHTFQHATCTGKAYDYYLGQLQQAQDWMIARGYTRNNTHRHLAWVGGQINQVGRDAAAALGVPTARGTSGSWVSHTVDRHWEYGTIVDRMNQPAVDLSDGQNGAAGATLRARPAIGSTASHTTNVPLLNARWTTLLHAGVALPADIPGTNSGLYCSRPAFDDWCRQVATLRDSGDLEVLTVGEQYERYGV